MPNRRSLPSPTPAAPIAASGMVVDLIPAVARMRAALDQLGLAAPVGVTLTAQDAHTIADAAERLYRLGARSAT